MQLYIFHGPGISAMGDRISIIKRNFDPHAITQLESKEASGNKLSVHSSQGSLFAQKRLLVIENPLELDLEDFSGEEGLSVILKFTKTLPSNSKILKQSLKFRPQIASFSEDKEQSIFPFLDLLGNQDPKALTELERYLEEWGGQYILTMLSYLLRRFIKTSGNL